MPSHTESYRNEKLDISDWGAETADHGEDDEESISGESGENE